MRLSKKEKRTKVLEYLKQNRLMSLGTSSANKPWAATVFFAYDKNLNLIFYSREDTRHCRHIKRNPYVSAAINQDWKEKGGIKGLQITGRASKITKKQYNRYYAIYKSRFRWADEFASDHILYLVKPLEVWYINQKLFGHFRRVKMI
ncbi:hypothetical protein A3B26_00570 [Candidatus Giovannonibacteria bacterium RIFCSPLOWO2_01_FULL_48_47]|nr:MAG: hypothetical protein A3D61_00070 [Candidatus Giovannonibacteria bacterium RIFCSPHIGHO2_02_FULL_48_15]OGF88160.1 MAG: hypothetical protein A3B26_00570 [Candidatus Giovannonibacteria bacterium RIFCSPLOWO2_01_FULL_48_47]OGF95901.1 MAG: hypothetical protein A2613_03740 [Candidatus Giovannonibacteria bacterium RIFOXYD1_FULL_48_21]HBT81579.1 hypothetical protein [Candidatus Giovannonibacteria bacterium]